MALQLVKNTAIYHTISTGVLSAALNGASAVSVHVRAELTTLDTGTTDNILIAVRVGANAGIQINVSGASAGGRWRVGGRAQSSDAFRSHVGGTSITGAMRGLGAVLNYGAGTVEAFVDGASDGSSAAAWGASVWTNGSPSTADAFGMAPVPPSVASGMWAGPVAELAIWRVGLSAADFAALNAGASPLLVRPAGLVGYWPLVSGSPASRIGPALTPTGSQTEAVHPRIFYPRGRSMVALAAAAAGTTGTAAVTAPVATAAASGSVTVVGTAATTAAHATAAAVGASTVTGTVASAAPTATAAATGTSTITGTATLTAPTATASVAGSPVVAGTVTLTAPVATASAAGYAADVTIRPIADITAGGWTPSTGSDLYAMLVDELGSGDSTYIRSPNDAGPNVAEIRLAPMTPPGSQTVQFRIRHRLTP